MASKKPRRPARGEGGSTLERRSPAQVIAATRVVLENVRRGLRDVRGGADDLVPGLHNVAIYGRSVTLALQRLRHIAPGFQAWYDAELSKDDPLLKFMNDARNAILKEAATPQTMVKMRLPAMQTDENGFVVGAFQNEPSAGATAQFFGDEYGGSGWSVQQPDGSETTYYSAFAHDFPARVEMFLSDAPETFKGVALADTTISGLCTTYYEWLVYMVDEAEKRFGWIR